MEFEKGAVIKEPGSSKRNKTGSWREGKKPVIDQEKCVKCSICWTFCPDSAIFVNEKGEYHVNYDYCKGCLICAEECPFSAIDVVSEER